ncbi:hypothetical protein ACH5RR_006578 [Cinchona calisaya]|uniref:Transmembrane protein n=1 Tax=Cinchona calisaya TaxID=153742 RepID=A0ABD3APD7_9GENT
MAQLDQNLSKCGRKTKKKKKGRKQESKKRCLQMSSNQNPPHTIHTHIHTQRLKAMFPEIPFCNPPKNPHLHHTSTTSVSLEPKNEYSLHIIFPKIYVGFLGFVLVSQDFFPQRKQETNQEPSLINTPSLFPPYFMSFTLSFFIPVVVCISTNNVFFLSFLLSLSLPSSPSLVS